MKKELFSVEFKREGSQNVLRINAKGIPRVPAIEDDPLFMSKTIDLLIEYPETTKIIFEQNREYEYEFNQVLLLLEIASLYKRLIEKIKSINLLKKYPVDYIKEYNFLKDLVFNKLKKDPIGSYVLLKRHLRHYRILADEGNDNLFSYIEFLKSLISEFENLTLIKKAKHLISGLKIGDRAIYKTFFEVTIKPDFLFTKLMATFPKNGIEIKNYTINDNEITIFELEDDVQYLYHLMPPEFRLDEEEYLLLDEARKILSEHKPDEDDFVNPERIREVFFNVGKDLLKDLSSTKKLSLSEEKFNSLTKILVRYTIGFGLIEALLEDENIQDITINSPSGESPIFIVHSEFGECKTNIIPSIFDAESWASKLRIMSGRPLDESNPVLDTEIEIPNIARARVGVIAPPLNPFGLGYAFRRHRDKPWTLPLFIKNKMLTPLAAGLISFLIDGNRTFLIAGTRSAGKTSLLGSMLVEILRKYRIITIEDTLELPVNYLRNLGFNIQPMKVAGAISKEGSEVPADAGIRSTLRLGDSCLIVGEVRSKEARALYEAMRVGALANVVAGTIHGDSPYGVFDRVVNDLEVPRTSFKATDIIIVANPIKSPDGLHKWRRITQITEVRKEWDEDPLREHAFIDLMKYNSETDSLEPTDDLINGNSDILKAIAGNVKEWAGNWDAVWDNILLRANIKEELLNISLKENLPDILEAAFVVEANDAFHKISDEIKEKEGYLNSKEIFLAWKEWLNHKIELIKHRKDYI